MLFHLGEFQNLDKLSENKDGKEDSVQVVPPTTGTLYLRYRTIINIWDCKYRTVRTVCCTSTVMLDMERRFKHRDSESVPRSPSGQDLTDDEDVSRVLISSNGSKASNRGGGNCSRRLFAICAAVIFSGALIALGLRKEV